MDLPSPGSPLKKLRSAPLSAPRGTSDGKYKEAAESAGRALGQTCALKPSYLTDRSTSKDGIARLAASGKPQPVRTWLLDLGFHHVSNRFKFGCALCNDGKVRDLKWDSILTHEDSKGHQKQEDKVAAHAASRARGLLHFGVDNVQQQEEKQLREARAKHDSSTLLEMAALFVLVSCT
jgi:hypothetical protein